MPTFSDPSSQLVPVSRQSSAPPDVALNLWPAGQESRPLDWGALQSSWMRRRGLFLLVFFGLLFLLLAFSWLKAPMYTATAQLQINTNVPFTNDSDLPYLPDITGANQTRSITTQTEILGNESVRDLAQKILKARDRSYVGASLAGIKAVPETNLIEVTASSRRAHDAAAFANAIGEAYEQVSREQNSKRYGAAVYVVGRQLNDTRKKLTDARTALQRYKQSTGSTDLAVETQNQLAELQRVRTEWAQTRADKQGALAQINRLRASMASISPTIVANKTIGKRPELVALQNRLAELETQRVAAIQEYQPGAPEVRSVEAEIAGLRAQMARVPKDEVSSQELTPNPARLQAEQSIVALEGQVSQDMARGTALKGQAMRLQSGIALLPAREARIGQLTTDLNGLQQSYQTLNQKYQTLDASKSSGAADGWLAFRASDPTQAVRPLTPLRLLICLALAAIVAFLVTLISEKADTRIRTAHDMPATGNVPLLAQIPLVRNPGEQCLISTQAMVSPLLENFRTLRTMIGLVPPGEAEPRVLAVTSSVPKEGKSLTAVNLAVAAALSGERVILVDCDLRWPALHHLCGRSNEVGFIDVVHGDEKLEDALQTTRVPNLYVLTSGPRSSNPFKILNSRVGSDLLHRLGDMADLVVVDTPPVSVLADARVTASLSDGVLLVVSTEEPSKDDVRQTVEVLEQSGAHIVGMVLNKVVPGPGSGYRDYDSLYPVYDPNDDALTPGAGDRDFTALVARDGASPIVPAEPVRSRDA